MLKYTKHASQVGHKLNDGQRSTFSNSYLCIAVVCYWHEYVQFVLGIQEQYTWLLLGYDMTQAVSGNA